MKENHFFALKRLSPLTTALLVAFSASLTSQGAKAEDELTACVDSWPEDLKRPRIEESFPLKGTSGHISTLELTVSHLPGERVFPSGLALAPSSAEFEWLKKASFVVPDAKSAVKPSLKRSEKDGLVTTQVSFPLIALPAEPGRVELTLPPLPIAISRASGTLHRICTKPHVITVEDPVASEPQPTPDPDPAPRPQIEVWTVMRDSVLTLLAALPLALLVAYLFLRFRKHFKRTPPPPPPIPPWETALAELTQLQRTRLLEEGEYEDYLDRVCDTLRSYLGRRYGFDGLESTTRELLRQLSSLAPDFPEEKTVRSILQRADLVKFARRLPSEEECQDAFQETRRLVERTRPAPNASTPSSPASNSKEDEA